MPVDPAHLRHHLNELRSTLRWLRSLPPDGPRYKLWLGDLVEFTRVAFGVDSPQAAQLRDVLAAHGRPPDGTDESERAAAYLARLDAFGGVLAEFDRLLPHPVTLVDGDSSPAPSG
jgi:hypothetical protein